MVRGGVQDMPFLLAHDIESTYPDILMIFSAIGWNPIHWQILPRYLLILLESWPKLGREVQLRLAILVLSLVDWHCGSEFKVIAIAMNNGYDILGIILCIFYSS